jgi:Flp pilus assembly protein TadG
VENPRTHGSARAAARETGQVAVFVLLFLVVLVGALAMVIDVGFDYVARRELQRATDAAALAGAQQLPGGWTAAQAAASSTYAQNGDGGDAVTYSLGSDLASGDSVVVHAQRTMPSLFARLFGITSSTVSATSQATVQAYTHIESNFNVMPWGVMQEDYVAGVNYPIYTDQGDSPQNGALELPAGPTCTESSGNPAYQGMLAGTLNACPLDIGDLVDLKPGQSAGPTYQGLTSRISSFQPVSSIVDIQPGGEATILDPTSPQLIYMPLLQNLDGSSTWPPTGSAQLRVVGFALFVITGFGSTGSGASVGQQVNGTFVTSTLVNSDWTTGPWTKGTGPFVVSLTQ